MTIQFLSQSPTSHETTQMLSSFKNRNSGRIFLLTGSFSGGKDFDSAKDLLSLIEWAATGKERELVVLVGVFDRFGTSLLKETVQKLAKCVVEAEKLYMSRKPLPPAIDVPISFYAVEKWHAKVIGLTGKGGRFHDVECAIFGSTNFTDSALYGDSFELDLFVDNTSDPGKELLEKFIVKVGALIEEGMKTKKIAGFHDLILKETGKLGSNFTTLAPKTI